ncbi:nucleic acid-binding protein [Halorubrum halophilum]|uniref:nucleic acid-binding protein n=1 Tax=Halorubrum halophilum TaxID=413816 RepID=UPI00186B39A5|nr:nucleic acid-binding protein [Halorubrum halophilum]
MTIAAVSDAGPLIHLAEIGSLELLSAFDTLLVPETVYKEVEAGAVPDEFVDLSYELVEANGSQVGTDELDAGERAAIAVAEDRGSVLLTDDLAAREAAMRMKALQRATSLFVTEAVVERGIRILDEQ